MANKLVTLKDTSNNILYPTTTTDKVIYTSSNNNLTNILTSLIADVNAIPLKVYPVGAIFITISTEKPADLFGGTWTQLSGGYALVTTNRSATVASNNSTTNAANHTPGDAYPGGLPNITGKVGYTDDNGGMGYHVRVNTEHTSGAFYGTDNASSNKINSSGTQSATGYDAAGFDASRCSSAYGMYQDNSDSVIPNHIAVIVWKRIA